VTFNLAGYQLVWAGMNEAGLMLSTMALGDTENPAPDERPPLNSPLWLQYLLDNFSTVEEVIASDSTVRITGSVDHFLVCDIAGECAAIEFLDGEMVVHTGDAMPVHALTNTPYAIALETWQSRTRQQIIDSGNGSRLRFAIAADRGTGFDPDGEMTAVDYAFETLEQVSDAHAPTSPTQWSIVFDPANLEIHFRTRDNPAIRHLALGGLDFSCKTPVLMHTIHATEPSGDISGELVPYDHDVSLDHMLDFLQQWDPSIPPVTIKVLLSQIEQAPCME
jgi:penicillin V acylase-like amidase (Ntn superfamily)